MPTEIDSLEIRINAKAKSAEDKVDDLIAKLDKLSTSLGKINGVKLNGLNINGVGGKLNSVENVSRNVGNSLNGLGGNTRRTTRLFNKFSNAITKSTKKNKSFIGTIKSVRSGIMTLYGAMSGIGSSVNLAQDYIEDFNYFTVALNKVGQESKENWKEAGYGSAQEYADSFKDRFGTLQKQMTGYTVDTKTGELDYNAGKNLGLDISKVMQFQSSIAQITNSAGMLGETSIMTSKALSMLSADWSSLANQDLSTVMKNMQSGLIGQSRAMYKYGIDITNANLQNYAYKIGLEKSVSEMTQAEKMQLRLLVILKQSKVAYGDLARTINQPANQLRMLQEGFVKLSRTVGQIFLPIIQNIYPYLNAVVMVLQEFAQWIAKLTGADKKKKDTSINLPDYEPAEEGSEKIADNTAKAAKSAKKLSDNLQGFDIINKLSDNDSSVDSSDSTSGNGAGADIDLSSQISTALGKYEKIWNEAFKSNENKAVQLANRIKKALLKGWKTGDFTEVGKSLATWINNGLEKIPWTKIKKNVKNVAKSFATFLNGSLLNLDWVLIGETIAEGFNTAIDGLYTFLTTFNFLEFGEKVGSGINSAIEKFNWSKLGKTLGAKMRGIVQFAFGAISNINFSGFGKRLGDGINGFFEEMGKVDKRTGLTGWQELGKSLSDSIKGILDTISTALDTVNWETVGKAIADFLTSIDWWGILGKVGEVISKALFGVIKAGFSAFSGDPIGIAKALSGILALTLTYKKLKTLWSSLKSVFSKGITQSISDSEIDTKSLTGKFSNVGTKLGKALGAAMALQIGLQIASSIGGSLLRSDIEEGDIFEKTEDGSYKLKTSTSIYAALSSLTDPDMWLSLITGNIDKYAKRKQNEIVKENNFVVDEKARRIEEDKQRKTQKKILDDTGLKDFEATNYQSTLDDFTKEMIKYGATTTDVKKYTEEVNAKIKSGALTVEEASKQYEKYIQKQKELKEAQGDASSISIRFKNYLRSLGISEKDVAKITSKYVKKLKEGKITTEDYAKIVKKYTAGAIKPAYSQTEKFSDGLDNLKKTFEKLGVSSKKQSEYIKILQEGVDSGAISLSEYRKITDNATISSADLSNEIKKIKSKTVEIKATTKGKEDVLSLKSTVDLLKDKNVMAKVTAGDTKAIDNLLKKLGQFSNKEISAIIGADVKLRKNWYDAVKKEIQSRKFSLNVDASIKKTTASKLKSAVRSMDGSKIDYNKLASVINNSKSNVTIGKQGQLFVSKNDKDLLKLLKGYGINYETYATGGFPGVGEFFVARENGPELVGNIGSRSAVVNNDQIVQSVSQGVAQATYAAVKAALSDMPQQGGGDVYIDGDKITSAIMGRAERITRSRGVGWQLT